MLWKQVVATISPFDLLAVHQSVVQVRPRLRNLPYQNHDYGKKYGLETEEDQIILCSKLICCCPDSLPCSSETRRQSDQLHCATLANR